MPRCCSSSRNSHRIRCNVSCRPSRGSSSSNKRICIDFPPPQSVDCHKPYHNNFNPCYPPMNNNNMWGYPFGNYVPMHPSPPSPSESNCTTPEIASACGNHGCVGTSACKMWCRACGCHTCRTALCKNFYEEEKKRKEKEEKEKKEKEAKEKIEKEAKEKAKREIMETECGNYHAYNASGCDGWYF